MDWLAAFREHPLDNIFTRVIVNLPALLLGFSLETIGGYIIFRGLWGNFIHSNTNFGLGAFKYILGSPRLHHWHHDINNNSNCNYANLMPVMDVIFGTFYDPGKMPAKYGIKEPFPRNYFLQILTPLLPEKLNRELLKRFNFIHR
jgi:sterol desaturase/sphingolipid hydroxylase (fatty acid hydroxylase superfamily)